MFYVKKPSILFPTLLIKHTMETILMFRKMILEHNFLFILKKAMEKDGVDKKVNIWLYSQ